MQENIARSNSQFNRNSILLITPPEEGKLRSRKIVSRSRARSTGKYPSWKMGRMIQWESPNERNAFRLLDANPAVKYFFEQPLKIRYLLDGEERLHYPDILVVTNQTKELWEIKPKSEATRPENMARTELMTKALPEFGFIYRMISAEDLARNTRMANVITLLKYGRAEIPVLDREKLRRLLDQTDFPWGAVIDGALGLNGRSYVCRLVLEGAMTFDLEEAITHDTILTRPSTSCLPVICTDI